ncbi:MAG: zinc ribbon domain-containing protein [Bacillota bacterium]|nr:zinc ribbon domain-containing protein [Bacillota bacterium]
MFIMMGINSQSKALDFHQMVVCESCGGYGRYMVFVTYTVFSLFFIPLFKWNKQYFVQMSCCDSVYQLDPDIGKQIERKENVQIKSDNLTLVKKSNKSYNCPQCGYILNSEFEYCPKCGTKL